MNGGPVRLPPARMQPFVICGSRRGRRGIGALAHAVWRAAGARTDGPRAVNSRLPALLFPPKKCVPWRGAAGFVGSPLRRRCVSGPRNVRCGCRPLVPGYPRPRSHRATPGTVCSAPDPIPQQSASSDPPQITGNLIARIKSTTAFPHNLGQLLTRGASTQ
jgi:hypothetical protein